MKSLKMALLLILILGPIILATNVNSIDNSNCSDFEFVFARGSGQSLNDSDYRAYKTALEEKLKDQKISFYELGEKSGGYPAVSANFSVSLGAIISAGESYKFGESVEKGTKELANRVKSESKRCKNKKFILAGYSQGAVVVDKTLTYLDSSKIFYVANFGDPKLYLPEGKRACKNLNLSNYRIYVPDCNVEEGILDGLKPYQPSEYYNKLGVWCNQNDIMCGSNLNILNPLKGHTSYNSKSGYKKFAELMFEKITNTSVELKPTEARYSESPKRDIAIIYDFSQMASSYFRLHGKSIDDDLKSRIIELTNHGTRVALYSAYSLQSPIKRLERVFDFTNDNLSQKIDKFNEDNKKTAGYLFGNANNIFLAIKEVSKTANWSAGSERNIFILATATYSTKESEDGTTHEDAIRAANENGVKVSFLSNLQTDQDWQYQDIINATDGASIGNDYSRIALNKNRAKKLFSRTFEINKDSEYTLVVVNGAVYGISTKKSITITNLDSALENAISLISYDKSGKKKGIETTNFYPRKIKAPNTGAV